MTNLSNMTRLEAVNRILRGAREHPVSSLGGGGESDSLIAEQTLDDVLRREQAAGLHVNTIETSFTPDSNNSNRVILPSNTLSVQGWNQHQYRNFYHREISGDIRLFDASETPASDQFDDDATVYVRLVQTLAFDDLPLLQQMSIVDQAAVEYQMAVLGSTSLNKHLQAVAARSRAAARAQDWRTRPNNQFQNGASQGPRAGRSYVPRTWPYNDRRQQD
jgi:hypothetical protein